MQVGWMYMMKFWKGADPLPHDPLSGACPAIGYLSAGTTTGAVAAGVATGVVPEGVMTGVAALGTTTGRVAAGTTYGEESCP
jgi:hypothetical protein